MTLKELINASGGSSRCASIWGITKESVSRIIKRNTISRGLIEELVEYHHKQIVSLSEILLGCKKTDFEIVDRKPPRSTKCDI
jgi:hypothetical protein